MVLWDILLKVKYESIMSSMYLFVYDLLFTGEVRVFSGFLGDGCWSLANSAKMMEFWAWSLVISAWRESSVGFGTDWSFRSTAPAGVLELVPDLVLVGLEVAPVPPDAVCPDAVCGVGTGSGVSDLSDLSDFDLFSSYIIKPAAMLNTNNSLKKLLPNSMALLSVNGLIFNVELELFRRVKSTRLMN